MTKTSEKCSLDIQSPRPGVLRLTLGGAWVIRNNLRPPPDAVLDAMHREEGLHTITFDTRGIKSWDSAFLTFLGRIESAARAAGLAVEHEGLPEGVRRLLDLAAAVPERRGARREESRMSLLDQIGVGAQQSAAGMGQALAFIGETVLGIGKLLRGKAQYRRGDMLLFIQECGVEALPIVALLSLLIGLILAFVGALQLTMFGAEVYVANLVGVGMAIEMGALMTGIIMAGRTGAAFAAQLGTMQVNEEIDALRTLGISPFEFLVLPRMTALILMIPLLCIFADVLGMLGGAGVGIGILDITPTQYFHQTASAVELRHVGQGLVKSVAFGMVIAICGCLQGMNCGRSAQAVGEATTRAVVQCIVWIVVVDATLTLLYNVLGI